jgi:epoxyqueuosine reductase
MVSKEDILSYTSEIKLDLIGFTDAKPLDLNLKKFNQWIASGCAGDMTWLSRNPEKRFNPGLLMPESKTIISVGISYFCHDDLGRKLISRYVRAKDYHLVLRDKLKALYDFIKNEDPGLNAKIFVDSENIAEKTIAQKAGLGWQGKNSLLINKDYGSWIFLGELLINREYPIDAPQPDHCNDCQLCIKACPTKAILDNHTIDARKCISYLAIEYGRKSALQDQLNLNGRVFGCDICQDVCPWNKSPLTTREDAFIKPSPLSFYSLEELSGISEDKFAILTKDTSLERISYAQFRQNLAKITSLNIA